jgi:Flp pilus assembly protein TadD
VATSPAGASGSRPDPKDRRELAARMAQVVTGEIEGAALRAALEAIVAEDPRNGQAQMRLGYALVESGDLRKAETHFRAALGASMPTADVHLGLAMCFASTGRPAEAIRALMEARRIEPGNPVVEANLGALALDGGDMTKAVEFLGAALQIDPDLHQARFNLARALARQGRRGEALKEAETLLQRLPAVAPQRAEVQRLIDALR